MTEAQLVAQYLARGGKVTICPPRTYSQDAAAPLSWREMDRARFQQVQHKKRMESATKGLTPEVVRSALEVATIAQAAEELGVSARYLRRRAASFGIQTEAAATYAKFKDVPTARIVELIAQGMSASAAGAKFGMGENTVRDRLKRAGLSVATIRARQARMEEAA